MVVGYVCICMAVTGCDAEEDNYEIRCEAWVWHMLHGSYLMPWVERPDQVFTLLSWLCPSFRLALSLQGVPSGPHFIPLSLQLTLLTQQPCSPCFSILQLSCLAGNFLQCTTNASGWRARSQGVHSEDIRLEGGVTGADESW